MHTIIRSLREKRGISQDTMAGKLGMSRVTYIRLESGEKSPTLDELKNITSILEVSLESLIFDAKSESSPSVDEEKYKQVLEHCIQFGADSDGKITKTKLAKLAYLADFAWYYEHLVPLTGLQYRRLEQWPVPHMFFLTIDELLNAHTISIEIKWSAQMIKNEDTPSANRLSEEEIKFIEKICRKWQGKSTKDIVDFTHKQLPWKICRENEIIPYELITQEEPNHVY